MSKLRTLLLAAGVTGGAYVAFIRPRILHWGTQPEDEARPLPGDDLVPQPRSVATRAVTIDAPPEAVWPWLAQMGQGRGGLYSYDWLENLVGCDIHSLDTIDPALQNLAVGDHVRLVPEDHPAGLYYEVAQVEPQHVIVLHTPGDPAENMAKGLPHATWTFYMESAGDGQTRLLARFRSNYRPDINGKIVNHYGLEPIHFMMERKMLLGIKARAEKATMQPA